MPYSPEHKRETRAKIVEAARILFNRHGFEDVTIDMVMRAAGLTRGGFYNHFDSKEALYAAAVSSFLMGRGAQWRGDAGVDPTKPGPDMARRMIAGYLSADHLGDLDGQCPMIALPSDIARANPQVRTSYQELLTAMVGLFEGGVRPSSGKAREAALSLAALCIGGMVLARTLPDSDLAEEVRLSAYKTAMAMAGRADEDVGG
ncbi:TetR/AcrR family transcriptional regulator [Parasphingopyxis lamellibrachiae]|uniref:TetR family transcriptional regulator n=1 Tax=Parasphingopyxis lamellibrachiae TaxID=680125 RepID=A0A3D9FE36_9SPHN|nr:TetR/AcrR family transcriptional regulator [Parasphingopyxis lamellibrachiae]RED15301.1 TetR family transcriptional regulator [Parasphingopyxis lamellibrachiae]